MRQPRAHLTAQYVDVPVVGVVVARHDRADIDLLGHLGGVGIRLDAVAGEEVGAQPCLLRGEYCARPPLRLVGVQQFRRGTPVQHHGEFPGQIVYVGDAGVGAVPAPRRVLMRCVAGEEDPAAAVLVGDVDARVPGARRQYVDRDVVAADRRVDLLERLVRGSAVVLEVEGPLVSVVLREDDPADRVVGDIALAERAAFDDGGQVGVHEDVQVPMGRRQRPAADAELGPHRAARAVGGDQVVRLDLLVADRRGHGVGAGAERRQFGAEAQVAAGEVGEHRFEQYLWAEAERGRARVAADPLLVQGAQVQALGLDQVPAMASTAERAGLQGGGSRLLDAILDADLPVQLDGSRVHAARPRQHGGTGTAFHEHEVHAVVLQKQRRRQADQPASHDQHRRPGHDVLLQSERYLQFSINI
nr:hypothetical protein [Kribbella soli]